MHADFSHPFLLSSPVQFEICSRSPSFNDHGHGLGPQFYIQLLFIAITPFPLKFENVLSMGKKSSIKNRIVGQNWRNCLLQLHKQLKNRILFLECGFYVKTVDKSGALGLEHGRVAVVNAAIIILSPWGNVHKWRPTIFKDFRPHPWPPPAWMSNFCGSFKPPSPRWVEMGFYENIS